MIEPRKVVSAPLTWSLSLGLIATTAGCGSSDSAGNATSLPPSASAPIPTPAADRDVPVPASSEAVHAATELPTAEPPGATPKPAARVVDLQQATEAREAFRVLTEPGTNGAQWDAAQQKLVALGTNATPVLVEGLKSSNPIERETAATICALTGATDQELQTALATCLNDESSFVRANAAASLAQVPEYQTEVISTLTSLLADADPQLRRMAAANLGAFGAEASQELPKLTAVLADNDTEVVTPVIQLLGRIGPQAVDAVPQLQKIAHEQEGDVKQAAEQALLLIQTDSSEMKQPKK